MRSIRRSLIGYFLVLTLVALTAMGGFIDQYTRTVLDHRRAEETKQLDIQEKERRQEEIEKLDQDLLTQAYALAGATQYNTFGRRFSQAQRDFSKLEIAFGFAGPLQAATIASLVQSQPVRFERPNPIAFKVMQDYYEYFSKQPLDSSFLHSIGDQDHFQDLYQVQISPTQTWQSITLGGVKLPEFTRSEFQNASFLPKHDVIPLANGTLVRRVVLAFPGFGVLSTGFGTGGGRGGGRGGRGGERDRPPPNPAPSAAPGSDGIPRIFVQVARPVDSLQSKFAEFDSDRNQRVAQIDSTVEREQNLLRVKLIGIVSAAVVALLVGSLVLTRRGLAPLDRLTAAVSRVSAKDFQLPVTAADLSAELVPVHGKLTESLDALKRAFEREKQAVADISHELRTPIAALGVTLDVALKKVRTPEQYRQTLADCRDINTQLGKLVERIMTLATLDAGTARSERVEVDAADLAAACATVIKPLAEAHGIALTTALARPLPVTTDPNQLREVLMNLLHNAVEYNRPGGVIELTATGNNGSGVTFGVRDSGIGMAPEVREKIFERFYRADPSRTATGVHAGLGLAIVKEYVARLGGSVSVESAPNVGSTFRVTLPAAAA